MVIFLCIGCATSVNNAGGKNIIDNYDRWMNEADKLATVLCRHSDFSSCFWIAALGSDADRTLPAEARRLLDDIADLVKGKTPDQLTECEKGKLMGMWMRFTYLVGESTIKKVTPYLIDFIKIL